MGCIGEGAEKEAFLGGASRPVWNFWREPALRAFTGRSPSESPPVESRRRQTPARLTAPGASAASADPESGTLLSCAPPTRPGEHRPGPEGAGPGQAP